MPWDTIVIGSGCGGLVAAVALARAGQRVLVLEQHYLPGGWTQSFCLKGYRFSPGVHYIGDLGEGGGVRTMFEGLGLSRDLEFVELNPDAFDHFLIAGETFEQPRGLPRYRARLVQRFPAEREGLDRYFSTVKAIARDLSRCDRMLEFPKILALPAGAPTLTRWGLFTHSALLDRCIKDPLLKAVLSAQCGNHGLPPSQVSLPAHAAMTNHYFDGGYYPRGGARSIPRAMIRELSRHGGAVRVKARVERILVRHGRAAGVRLSNGETLHANNVVCNADPAKVLGTMLAPEHCGRALRTAARMEYSVSLLSVFCAVEMDLRGRGYDSGNYWYYRDANVDGLYTRMQEALPRDRVDGLFLTITTLKDPERLPKGHHTLEMFTFVPYAPFARWAGHAAGERPPEYEALKKRLGDMMLEAAENIIPGLRENLRFVEVATPVTNDFYCETHRGAAYGTAKTPWQLGPFSFSQRGPIRGLHFCGASTLSHGVGGAATSGLFAARAVLGARKVEDLLAAPDGSLRTYPADEPHRWVDTVRLRRQTTPIVREGPAAAKVAARA